MLSYGRSLRTAFALNQEMPLTYTCMACPSTHLLNLPQQVCCSVQQLLVVPPEVVPLMNLTERVTEPSSCTSGCLQVTVEPLHAAFGSKLSSCAGSETPGTPHAPKCTVAIACTLSPAEEHALQLVQVCWPVWVTFPAVVCKQLQHAGTLT